MTRIDIEEGNQISKSTIGKESLPMTSYKFFSHLEPHGAMKKEI